MVYMRHGHAIRDSILLSVALLGGAPVSTHAWQERSILLNPTFQPGSSYYVEWTQDTLSKPTQSDEVFGGKQEKRIKCVVGAVQTLKAIRPDGNVEYELVFDRLAHHYEAGDKVVHCDTDESLCSRDRFNPMMALFQPMLDAPMTMVVDSDDGTILLYEGMETIFKKVETSLQNHKNKAGLEEKLAQMKCSFNDDFCRAVFGQNAMLLYPFKSVEVGETWNKNVEKRLPHGLLVVDLKCELSRVLDQDGRRVAIVDYTGEVRQKESRAGQPHAPQIKNLRGAFQGTARFDSAGGLFVADRQEGTFTLDVEFPSRGLDHPAQVLQIDQVISNTYHVVPLTERQTLQQNNAKKLASTPSPSP